MKPLIWHPDEKDAKVNEYLDHMNHAPYGAITMVLLSAILVFTFILLVGIF